MTIPRDAARVAAVVDGATCTVTFSAQLLQLRVFFVRCVAALRDGLHLSAEAVTLASHGSAFSETSQRSHGNSAAFPRPSGATRHKPD